MTIAMAWGKVRAMGLRGVWLVVFVLAAACAEGVGQEPDAAGQDADAGNLVVEDAARPDAVAADACVLVGAETCDGTDEDCDGEIDEGFDIGTACDSDDEDLCPDDLMVCSPDGADVECVDEGAALIELCNGLDDDCRPETSDGSADPNIAMPCDGADSDLCQEGTFSCALGSLQCSDLSGSTADVCNGQDDDCDPASADGSEDPRVGALCDGADGDLCNEGTAQCAGGAIVCSDLTTTTVDLCNGFDDDCDPGSADGSEDPQNGLGCDGPDGDLCIEGTNSCAGGQLQCSDTTGSTSDLCNGLDDDCDGSSGDGSEDPLVGAACDGADSDQCMEGSTQCVTASILCSDQSADSLEVCNGIDDDCNGQLDEGFPRDTNPPCTGAAVLGTVSGDLGPDVLTASGGDERWFRVTISENSFSSTPAYLSARVDLQSPADMDFDLFVYCESCGGTLAGSSTQSSGLLDSVDVRRNDGALDESFEILIEVRFFGATTCSNWDLTLTSDTAAAAETCAL